MCPTEETGMKHIDLKAGFVPSDDDDALVTT